MNSPLTLSRREAAMGALAGAASSLERSRLLCDVDRVAGLMALEVAVDALWEDYRERLTTLASGSELTRWCERIDAGLRTDRDEYMDAESFSDVERARSLEELHQLNTQIGTYGTAFELLYPTLSAIALRERRAPRLLDLASGHGGFPMALARIVAEEGVPLDIAGSDVQPIHVEHANANAKKLGLEVPFLLVNGFDMKELHPGQFDLLSIMQSIHHFRPGQLARLIAESLRVAGTGLIGIDGIRAPWFAPIAGIGTLVKSRNPWLAHDAIVSVLKAYDAVELELIARAAAPRAQVKVTQPIPTLNCIEVLRL